MLFFPQLSTGASAQLPFTYEYRARTVVNEVADGSLDRLGDAPAQSLFWRLPYRGLSDGELKALTDLHAAVAGGLRTFTFLDPADNLLRWSEELTSEVWTTDGLLTVSKIEGEGDAVHHLVNTAQAEQSIGQILAAPAGLVYALSFEARAAERIRLAAERSAAGLSSRMEFDIGPDWTGCVLSGRLASDAEEVEFRILIPPGAPVDLRRVQVEAQPGRSQYKPTYAGSGVYRAARFNNDDLRVTTHAMDDHEVSVELITGMR